MELALPEIVLEAGAGPGGRPLPGKGCAAVDRLLAKVELHRLGRVASRFFVRPGRRARVYRVTSSPVSPSAHFVIPARALLLRRRHRRPRRDVRAAPRRAAPTRIENALRRRAPESRAPPPRPGRFYVPGIYSESPIRSRAFLSPSLLLSLGLSDRPLRAGSLGSSRRRLFASSIPRAG